MNYWLVKSEPDTFSWNDLVTLGRDMWNGVRNYQARNNLMAMTLDDLVLFYHSVKNPGVVGIAKVVSTHYPDPTSPDDPRWVVVDLAPEQALEQKVSLASIKQQPELAGMLLLRQSRLSVMPVTTAEFHTIVQMGKLTVK
ncbi:MAG: EVE domain-containing protein [Chitinophagales bacterium]|jgi:predicted RNA-binding protein with PUA-like domain|nr:EVE domain-containing protein [Chitinophagales bacterium]